MMKKNILTAVLLSIFILSSDAAAGVIQDVFNFPNPFSVSRDNFTTVRITLAESSDIEIRIFNLFGDLVRKEEIGETASCDYKWYGKNDRQMTVANGIYILAVIIKDGTSVKEVKMRKIAVSK